MSHQSPRGKDRPACLRALGRWDPPKRLIVNEELAVRVEIYKHDSWAATACYESANRKYVCKFNRIQPIVALPMSWLGRILAKRESFFLTRLAGIPGIPMVYSAQDEQGQCLDHVSAHEWIDGKPLSILDHVPVGCLDRLERLIDAMHQRQVAYVDLHKQENIVIDRDGNPHLVDFQISFFNAGNWFSRTVFKWLVNCDRYHMQKHRHRWLDGVWTIQHDRELNRPWCIRLHRVFAVPLRTIRRRFLVLIGVRRHRGEASTEATPECGLRTM